MKRQISSIVITLLVFNCLLGQNKSVIIGQKDTIFSKILGEKREIIVHVPKHGDVNKRYPVLYLLDGSWHFSAVVGILDQMSYINGNTKCPEMIVVGIPLNDRFKDLTSSCDTSYSKTSGGFEKFISFVKEELFIYIDSLYPTAPYKMFVGHSLAGLAVMNTLAHHQDAFNSYIAIDPSIWWDNQRFLNDSNPILSKSIPSDKSIFLAVANTMVSGMDTTKVRSETGRNSIHIRSILQLKDKLESLNGKSMNFKYKFYADENHASVPLISIYDGLRKIFDFYDFSLTRIDFEDPKFLAGQKIVDHYLRISKIMGYEIKPSKDLLLSWSMNAEFLKNPEALAFCRKLIDLYYPPKTIK
jgi:predicted alpha/beta superfamily hydrolase